LLFEPKGVYQTRAAWLPPSGLQLRFYLLDVFETHLKHVQDLVGPARLGSDGLEHEQNGEALGAWVAVANDDRIFLFQTPFREDPSHEWEDDNHAAAANAAFALTVAHFDGVELTNDFARDGSWERYIGNLLRSEASLVGYEDLISA